MTNLCFVNKQKILFFLDLEPLDKTLLVINTFTSRDMTSNIIGRGAGVAGLSAAGSRCNTETTGNGNNKGFPRNLKTNNFFLPPSLKWIKSNKTAASNSLATSPVIFGKDVMRWYVLKVILSLWIFWPKIRCDQLVLPCTLKVLIRVLDFFIIFIFPYLHGLIRNCMFI